jgi:hypothetical protein
MLWRQRCTKLAWVSMSSRVCNRESVLLWCLTFGNVDSLFHHAKMSLPQRLQSDDECMRVYVRTSQVMPRQERAYIHDAFIHSSARSGPSIASTSRSRLQSHQHQRVYLSDVSFCFRYFVLYSLPAGSLLHQYSVCSVPACKSADFQHARMHTWEHA